jgi:hypothetical protein
MSGKDEDTTGQLSYESAHTLLVVGKLPVEFKQWGLVNKNGWTIAHQAAFGGRLPVEFKQWDMANTNGWTVAHVVVAIHRHLPADFNQWDLADKNGWTVAHEAASYGQLPANFSQWGIADKGVTVLGILKCNGMLGSNNHFRRIMQHWDKEKPLCRTNADWEVFKQELPEVYYKYAIDETMVVCDEVSNGVMI